MIYIKQYGAKRTGTNYLRWLLENNFENIFVLTDILGWKHGIHPKVIDWTGKNWLAGRADIYASESKLAELVTPDMIKSYEQKKICYLVIIKNPYSYYVSNVKQYEKPKSHEYARTSISTWNYLYGNWSKFCKSCDLSLIIRFEDLILNKKETLNLVAKKFGLASVEKLKDTNKELKVLSETTKNIEPLSTRTFDATVYEDKKYMKDISSDILHVLNDTLNKDIMNKFSYNIEHI